MENELKQKQIEEMEKDIAIRMAGAKSVAGSMNNGVEGWIGKYLIERGWTKIPENAVVVPDMADKDFYAVEKSEWDKMVQGTKDIIREREEKARKEVADKFAELAKAKLNEWLKDNEDNDGKIDFGIAEIELIGVKSLEGEVISESLIDEIAKEITEGEKEISNETV